MLKVTERSLACSSILQLTLKEFGNAIQALFHVKKYPQLHLTKTYFVSSDEKFASRGVLCKVSISPDF